MNFEQSTSNNGRVRECGDCGESRLIQGHGLCRRCYKRWKRATDPDYAARDRVSSARWKDRNREANRARDNARAADESLRGRCQSCGDPMGAGLFHDGICQECRSIARSERWAAIERMWLKGATLKRIAETLDSTPGSVAVDVTRMRNAGIDLPYRRKDKVAA